MNTVPLILILILAVCSSSSQVDATPCTDSSDESKYNNFNKRHVLPPEFNRTIDQAWTDLLWNRTLCEERGKITFLERSADDICTANGRQVVPYEDHDNLCRSGKKRRVYQVEIKDDSCSNVRRRDKIYVVVACNKVKNMSGCHPVHYQAYNNRMKIDGPCLVETEG